MPTLRALRHLPGRMAGHRGRIEQGVTFEATAEQARVLEDAGYAERIGEQQHPAEGRETQALSVDDLERSGSWYVLPSGEKVQGKDEAAAALKKGQ